MFEGSLFLISGFSILISVMLIYWIYNINKNVNKVKKILYAQLMIQAKLAKKEGEEIDIESLYRTGD